MWPWFLTKVVFPLGKSGAMVSETLLEITLDLFHIAPKKLS
jgi:hypothetical protein